MTSIDKNTMSPNYMNCNLQLYYTPYVKDNNQFIMAVSSSHDGSYRLVFTDNQSIMTCNTSMSIESIPSITVPAIVMTNKEGETNRDTIMRNIGEKTKNKK